MATTSQTDHSSLVEAVAAMNVTASSPSPIPSANATSSTTGARGGDSGYASQTSTPDTLKVGTFANGSVAEGHRFLWPRRIIRLKPFKTPIPHLTRVRFEDLREQYAESLNDLTKGVSNCRGILMSLKGEE